MPEDAGRLDRRTVIDEARRAGVIGRTAALVAVALNDYADARGILAGLGYADLAYLLAMSKATVYRAVRELCSTGLVRRIQTGRGWRKARYAVAPNSSRGDLGRLRAVPMCSHAGLHTEDKNGLKALTPRAGLSFSTREVHEPDRAWGIVRSRGVLPDGLEERECRALVHLAAACARSEGIEPPKFLRWLLTVPHARSLARVCRSHRPEAERTLREADDRERLSTLERARRSALSATCETSGTARALEGFPEAQERDGPRPLAELFREAVQASQEGLA